jgi:hypothetical protein
MDMPAIWPPPAQVQGGGSLFNTDNNVPMSFGNNVLSFTCSFSSDNNFYFVLFSEITKERVYFLYYASQDASKR